MQATMQTNGTALRLDSISGTLPPPRDALDLLEQFGTTAIGAARP